MPSSCDPLFDEWQKAGNLSIELVLERINLAIKSGNTGLATYLAKRLPMDYQTINDAIVELQDHLIWLLVMPHNFHQQILRVILYKPHFHVGREKMPIVQEHSLIVLPELKK